MIGLTDLLILLILSLTLSDHLDYLKNVAGAQHVGIGSDFDGMEQYVSWDDQLTIDTLESGKIAVYFSAPIGLEDTSMFPNLVAEMLLQGWTEEDVQKVIGGNFIRVLTEVETVTHIKFFMFCVCFVFFYLK